ncbi:MAG: 1-deoxy-D-xylulose-5-phosphate reductoisomerase [Desulfobulbaceae bacterium]|jgi:1-deoxy-D-xylulose-5-phosphate reductoisomerase|nr:1-deoxy-D-xylulose-5-phosphate reductoisomerase [Desulfobulbaceae bacterium]
MKKIAILGSTGSIGVNALRVIQANPEKYQVTALAAGKNIRLLLEQIKRFRPLAVAVMEETAANELKAQMTNSGRPEIFFGTEGFIRLATMTEVDTIISAMAGAAGLLPTYSGIKAGRNIALANKETMVMAGSLVMAEARKHGVSILPIDSEHSAILQSLQGHPREDLRRVILTASGGPFRDLSLEEMSKVTPAQALNHPNWNMGPKVSIDSSTMMNKGLEAIEAKWLFDLKMDQISILIHSQSIVHSMVEYKDGSIISQMGVPDMIIPISFALSFPHHLKTRVPPLELEKIGILSFEKPDMKRFRCLDLALKAAEIGGSMPAVLNGANEIAVESFLKGNIGFLDIPDLIEKTMASHKNHPIDSIETVMEVDRWARDMARSKL